MIASLKIECSMRRGWKESLHDFPNSASLELTDT